ncbi:MAG: RsmB/NOP family class I SAM-dependent RNA methyltransferase [Magnetococcales bacterium]|nr:RsmB/NOP family class I SAM-dependent RNA methyltransferase [Magnetococcales bacterium]MBF0420437.1 RsmB/NOP family class I SAM-dependent RNA methyltransferase [Magnetococcales bacterium]
MPDHSAIIPGTGEREIAVAGQLLERVFSSRQAADRILDHHFRAEHTGQLERRRLGALVYGVLRHRSLLQAECEHYFPEVPPGSAVLAAMALVMLARGSGVVLDPPWPPPLANLAQVEDPLPQDLLPPWIKVSLPQWIWQHWSARFGGSETEALMHCMNTAAAVDVRVNIGKTTRDAVLEQLRSLGVRAEPTPFSPDGCRLEGHPALVDHPSWRQGFLEVQDEGSQIISHLVAPKPGMTVVDFCAGAGGKTLHMAALMRDRGRIWAVDTEVERIRRMQPRIKRGGIRSIRTLVVRHEGDAGLKKLFQGAERVLVDVPCSATGTLRRNPEIKWRLTPDQLETYHLRQCAIIQAASRLVAPRGRLIYATCSLMERENEAVVQGFLAENRNFRPVFPQTISTLGTLQRLLPPSPFFTLLPHRTGTDGFFAAILERQS